MKLNYITSVVTLISLVVMITSCDDKTETTVSDSTGEKYTVIEIDGCQYLKYQYREIIGHKGNCNNPIHKCK